MISIMQQGPASIAATIHSTPQVTTPASNPPCPFYTSPLLCQHPPQAAAGGCRRALACSVTLHRLRLGRWGRSGLGGCWPRGWRWWVGAGLDGVAGLHCDAAHAGLAAAHAQLDEAVITPLWAPAVLYDPVVVQAALLSAFSSAGLHSVTDSLPSQAKGSTTAQACRLRPSAGGGCLVPKHNPCHLSAAAGTRTHAHVVATLHTVHLQFIGTTAAAAPDWRTHRDIAYAAQSAMVCIAAAAACQGQSMFPSPKLGSPGHHGPAALRKCRHQTHHPCTAGMRAGLPQWRQTQAAC